MMGGAISLVWKVYAYMARYGRQSWKDIDDLPLNEGYYFFDAISEIIKKESGDK